MQDIYFILTSKPHNSHYLRRYYKFIINCREKNKSLDKNTYTEIHHICPKAKDLFPEYKNFKIFKWNEIKLTARQHIIAHLILWKTYGKSQAQALHCMLDNFNSKNNINLKNRIIHNSILTRYLSKTREEAAKIRGLCVKGKATYIDSEGKKYFIKTNDPIINELDLVGNNKGKIFSEESLIQRKEHNKRIKLYKEFKTIKVLERDYDTIQEKLSEGYSLERDEELYNQRKLSNKAKQNEQQSIKMKGLCQHYYADGTHYGMIYRDDPIIKQLNLQPYKEDNRQIAISNCYKNHKDPKVQKKKSETMSKKVWYYDPSTNINYRFNKSDEIPSNYIQGRFSKIKIKKITINNGLQNIMILPEELSLYLDQGWLKGMKPRKQKI